jgi:hypothetical protein
MGLPARVSLSGQRLDVLLQNLSRQKARHLHVMLKKMELHVDRLIEQWRMDSGIGVSSALGLC